jgi:hypothetical protein
MLRRAARRGRATENILFRKGSAIALVVEALNTDRLKSKSIATWMVRNAKFQVSAPLADAFKDEGPNASNVDGSRADERLS